MIKRIAIVIAGIIIIVLGRGFFFYSGFYSAPPSKMPSYEHYVVTPTPSAEFSDNISKGGKGVILIDLAHDNNFHIEELDVLMLRLVSRGQTIKLLGVKDDLKKELLGEEKKTTDNVSTVDQKKEEPLPNAFIIVCPEKEFTKGEKESIEKFVDNGGKLLLIADPTRQNETNSISLKFGVIFEPDYLYNMKENEINFRNIFVTEFKENEITKNLKKIVLYTAGSVSSNDGGLAFVDQNTFSSVIESRKRLSPIALAKESKVLAVHDLTFISEPYNGSFDNNRLIANIADWLAKPLKK